MNNDFNTLMKLTEAANDAIEALHAHLESYGKSPTHIVADFHAIQSVKSTESVVNNAIRGNTIDQLLEFLNERISEIDSDERMSYPKANVQTNAFLALHQSSMAAKRDELEAIVERLKSMRE